MTVQQDLVGLREPVEKIIPNGPGAAAILAAGIGCAAVGVLAFASELSPGLRGLLNFYNPVGPLSGKTTVAIIIWLVAWYGLSWMWRGETVNMRAVNVAALILLGIGLAIM